MSRDRMLAAIVSGVVLTAIITSFILLGAPSAERIQRLDEQRVADLQQLTRALAERSARYGALPDDLSALVDGQLLHDLPRDPETGLSYDYVLTGTRTYRLCANFSAASRADEFRAFWTHAAGYTCFDFANPGQ